MTLANLEHIAPCLDKHLLYPLLDFLEREGGEKEVGAAKQKLLSQMQFYDLSIQSNAGNTAAIKALDKRKQQSMKKLGDLTAGALPLLSAFFKLDEQPGGAYRTKLLPRDFKKMRDEEGWSRANLATAHGVSDEHIQKLYELAWNSYEVGMYDQASDLLKVYLLIDGHNERARKQVSSARWGRLVCDTLMGWWDEARADISELRNLLDDPSTTVRRRTWLLHWAMFTYFKANGASHFLLDLAIEFQSYTSNYNYTYVNAIEVAAPHLIRYLAAAAIMNAKTKRQLFKRILNIVERNSYRYSDPITQFLDAVGNQCDFDRAAKLLPLCEAEFHKDFFFRDLEKTLLKSARMVLFEDYLRVHRTVSIPAVAEQLGMDVAPAELWLVNLIRDSKIDAKVDSVNQLITVAPSKKSLYRDVLDRLDQAGRSL